MTGSLLALALAAQTNGADPVRIVVRADRPTVAVSPSLYGIFFEEINQAGDGGVYGELLRNRGFEGATGTKLPAGWTGSEVATIDTTQPLNAAHPASLRLTANLDHAGVATNEGFWGVPLKRGARYRLVVWAKGTGNLTASLVDANGKAIADSPKIGVPGSDWKRFESVVTARATDPKAKLTFRALEGTTWIGYASLMPLDTWKGRPNGLRKDLATAVADMKPSFVRFPGGCYVEGGDRLADAFDWKRSVGPVEERKGLPHSMWGYSNTFGLGYHEYLQWCEDLGAAPLYVVNCGLSHREMTPMTEMNRWVGDALDAIEYANGPTTSKWGALRAKNGHPKPFGLKYVEIGNENGYSWSYGGPSGYAPRYQAIYDAIKKAHPEIVTIANNPVPGPMEVVDEHYYESPDWFWRNAGRYDGYDRKGPKIYVGEYAVTKGSGEGNLASALGEAAFMVGMERNADVVAMSSYAPLFVNVNNRQWNPNAIVFDASRSYGTPSYYVQAMFAGNRADRNVEQTVTMPTPKPPSIVGGVGLQTWRTKAEFKEVKLEADGRPVPISGWKAVQGDWTEADGTLRQEALDTDRYTLAKGVDLTGAKRVVLSLKARKLAGDEGFIVMTDAVDDNGLNWNLGGWGNTQHAFQRSGAILGQPQRGRIETGRWYDIRLEREDGRIRGYLDGKLVQEFVEPPAPDFAALAGIDDRAHELVMKVVNGANAARDATLDLSGAKLGASGKALTLRGAGLNAENSFADPARMAPKLTAIPGVTPQMRYTFAPLSVTILRFPIRR